MAVYPNENISEIPRSDVSTSTKESTTMLKCDFCNSKDIAWRYPCHSFVVPWPYSKHIINESVGDWAACEECSALIEANDRERLYRKTVESFKDLYGFPMSDDVLPSVRDLHYRFFKNRYGERQRT